MESTATLPAVFPVMTHFSNKVNVKFPLPSIAVLDSGGVMSTFKIIEEYGDHEQVVFCNDRDTGLKAIIAIHNTNLGPALGGCRMFDYASEEDALVDVLRLSRGMTYKAAASGLNLGGGKAVIIGDPKTQKTEGLFRAFGQFVNSLNGRYFTAEDVGTTVRDMEYAFTETPYVTGIPKAFGGSGDPSPYTAYGVLQGIKASAKYQFKADSLKGIKIAVQGLGSVGGYLVDYLVEEGAKVKIADIDKERVTLYSKKHDLEVVNPSEVITTSCDILAPCAMGSVINDETIENLKCKVVCGGANNQLEEDRHGDMLRERGILYAPDYVVNAGGLMNVVVELEGYSGSRAKDKTIEVYHHLMSIFKIAEERNLGTHKAADLLAEERISTIGKLHMRHPGRSTRSFTNLREVFKR